ncbi:ABC transporter ATP-binding protein [Microvirga pudoricolor]|uniref:ABC transporter ATP-binding protein n=1 Tax=Microvirga pudoricolor TaxID=2778729 RepID=UPI0019525F54|nr:ABC transporter ATP-binding protein [Microvirga pudoricolor]MBM6596369.1 ABC transporter ATP-binding protein [Microvirga pudoricolor]
MTLAEPMVARPITREPAIAVAGLSITARDDAGSSLPLVKDISFTCNAGEVTALIGESGSGKSLTATALLGLLDPDVYDVRSHALSVAGYPAAPHDPESLAPIRGRKVGYIVQDPGAALDPTMKVGDQLAELFMIHRGMSHSDARREVIRLLNLVRIPNATARADDYPHQFSGGMKQRVIIAGAVALSPEVLIADEPTTALDVTVQAEILTLIDDLRNEYAMGVLLITHDLGVVYQVADRVLVMYAGRIVEKGEVEAICSTPAHPYTAGLLVSVPDLSRTGAVSAAIPGSPPRPGLDRGCPFAPRCFQAQSVCATDLPVLQQSGHTMAACHFPISDGVRHG